MRPKQIYSQALDETQNFVCENGVYIFNWVPCVSKSIFIKLLSPWFLFKNRNANFIYDINVGCN
jgi:hypothetical protein